MPKPKVAEAPVPEARYPEIGRLLETENFNRVNKNFTEAYAALEKISKIKGLKKAADARKGMKAIERVMDLLKDLLRRKYQTVEAKGVQSPLGKK